MIKNPLIIGIIVFTALSGAATAYASAGSFTVYPSHTHNGNRNWIIRSSAPGNTVEESLTLENLSYETQKLTIEVKEAREVNGNFTPITAQSYKKIGNWIRLPRTS